MKKTFSLMLVASLIVISAFTPQTGTSSSKSKKIFWGSQTISNHEAGNITVYYEWNTSAPIGSRVQGVTVTDNNGFSTFTVTYHDQYPYMNLVNGAIVANGWRCNFVNQNGAAYYVVLGSIDKP